MATITPTLVSYEPATGSGGMGTIIVNLAFSGSYAQNVEVLNLSSIVSQLPNFDPADVRVGEGVVTSTGDWVVFERASSPTLANLGILRIFQGNAQKSAGAYTATAVFTGIVAKAPVF